MKPSSTPLACSAIALSKIVLFAVLFSGTLACQMANRASHLKGLDVTQSNIAASAGDGQVTDIRILPNTKPPKGVFAVLRKSTKGYVKSLYRIIFRINTTENLAGLDGPNQEITLVVVTTESDIFDATVQDLRYEMGLPADSKMPYLQHIHDPSLVTDQWLQDWGEFASAGVNGSQRRIYAVLDVGKFPSFLVDTAPEKFADIFKIPLVKVGNDNVMSEANGDLGGNIEATPAGRAYVGNTISPKLLSDLKSLGNRDTLVLPVDWLDVGHVDEVFMFIPARNACNGALAYASPLAGLSLALSGDQQLWSQWKPPFDLAALTAAAKALRRTPRGPSFTLDDFDLTRTPSSEVEAFLMANLLAEREIQIGVGVFEAAGTCGEDAVPLPALFGKGRVSHSGIRPLINDPMWSTGLYAALPSATNGLVLRDHVIVPDSKVDSIRLKVKEQLARASHGLVAIDFIDTAELHPNLGEIHCATAVVREPNL